MCKAATEMTPSEPRQHLHVDFGFVRGSDWSKKDLDGKLVTSMNGYRSYRLVIDRVTRCIWILLTKTKSPLVPKLQTLLKQLGTKVTNTYKTVTMDLGGELTKAKVFQSLLVEEDI